MRPVRGGETSASSYWVRRGVGLPRVCATPACGIAAPVETPHISALRRLTATQSSRPPGKCGGLLITPPESFPLWYEPSYDRPITASETALTAAPEAIEVDRKRSRKRSPEDAYCFVLHLDA
ncbi:hypothetical protein GCM10010448_07460 [Streptomyces glomeratus]|uniref:Uncharacterized protein n=1 Tax=Streptomyces glomeratus TaxID=284452 RepID=A0ABP6KZF8_9ACTN